MRKNILKSVSIDHDTLTPKYQQVVEGIMREMENGVIQQNDILPSLHELCVVLDVSKNTVAKAYEKLKQRGIVGSVRGKGYFIAACKDKDHVLCGKSD